MNYQLNGANKFGYIFLSDDKIRNHRGANSTTQPEATQQQFSDTPWGFANPTHQIQHTLIASDRLVFNNSVTFVGGGFFLDYQDRDNAATARYIPGDDQPGRLRLRRARVSRLPLEHPGAQQPHHRRREPRAARRVSDRASDVGREVRRHLLPDPRARRRPQPEVRARLPQGADHVLHALQRRRAARGAVRRQHARRVRRRQLRRGGLGVRHRAVLGRCSIAIS